MSDLLYGRGLNVLVRLLLLIVAYAYVRVIRRYRDAAIARIAAAGVAVPAMGAVVIFQIHLFRAVTGVSRPLHSDSVFFTTLVGEGVAMLAILYRGAMGARRATAGE